VLEQEPKLGNKGQGALEYMMTYGWAILIMGVVAVVLWQMGVFNPATTPPGCTGFSQIRPADWRAVKSSNNVSLTLSNDAGTKIRLDEVNVTINGVSCVKILGGVEMRAGATYPVGSSDTPTDCPNLVPDAKGYYRAEITIVYKNIASEIDHRSVGECHGTVEP
jgi:hypothetical protein